MPAWVDVDLDTIRKIRFQHNDIADLEQREHKGFGQLLQEMQFHGARVLLAYGLRWMTPKITAKEAGDLIQAHWIEKGRTLNELSEVLEEALIAGGILPKKEQPTVEGNAQPEAATTT